ncbi:MAG: metallophosphoesterase family protein [Promethearchaeota archaeon]
MINRNNLKKIAIVADLHGNKYALEVFLAYLEEHFPADAILNLGDSVAIGPHPKEVLEITLNDPRFISVLGNNDITLFSWESHSINENQMEHYQWVRQEVGPALIDKVKTQIPKFQILTIQNQKVLLVHSRLPPHDSWDTPLIYQNKSLEQFADDYPKDIDWVFFGHMHEQTLYRWKKQHFLNPGAIGCSKSPNTVSFCLMDLTSPIPNISFKNISYNPREVRKALIAKNVPDHKALINIFYPE